MTLSKSDVDLDSLNLEGLEDLLDQIFGPSIEQALCEDVNRTDAAAWFLGSATAHSGELPQPLCANLTDTRVARPKKSSDIGHPKQIQVLANQVKLLRARLQFALEQLGHARRTEASLRLCLAHHQDQLNDIAQDKAINVVEQPCELSRV